FDDAYELATFPVSVYEHILLQEAIGDKARHVYESEQKQILLVNQPDGRKWPGTLLGLPGNMLSAMRSGASEKRPAGIEGSTYLAHAQKYVDEDQLPAVVRKLLENDAAMLNREFFGVLDDTTSEPPPPSTLSGDEPLYRSEIVEVKTVKDLKETLFELRNTVFDGTVQCIIVGLPPASKECPARLQQLPQLSESAALDHVAFYFVPPPPSSFPSYATIVEMLLSSPEPGLVRTTDSGRSLLTGRWHLFGLDVVRNYIVEVKGLERLRRDRLMRELAPPPAKSPKPPVRLQSIVVVPPPRASPLQGTSSGRPFRPASDGRSGEPYRQSGRYDRHRRASKDEHDQKRRRQ
ncbi:hypothetical protein AAVH_39091, partial [Aphelenchoides avenae]